LSGKTGFLRIASITGAHGLHGRLKVFAVTDLPERFTRGSRVYIEEGASYAEHRISEFHVQKGRQCILGIEGLNDRDGAILLKGKDIYISAEDAECSRGLLESGSFYYYDLIGCRVLVRGSEFGEVVSILEAGAGEVLIIRDAGGKERMVPFVASMVNTDRIAEAVIEIDPVDCLFDAENR